jgi:chitinase
MRFTRTSALIAAALPVAAGAALLGANQFANAAGPAFPAHYSAPYLQVSNDDVGDMAADMSASGDKYYTLAFLTPQSGCTPIWEDGGESVGSFKSQIQSLQAAGGNVIISFGGAEGGELAQTCTSTSSLTAAYANIVNTYGVNRLDFDIEGGVLDDTAATTRRNAALAALQQQNPNVQIDFTLQADLPQEARNLLTQAKNDGVHVSVVNLMTMDYGDGENTLADAEQSATDGAGTLSNIFGVSTSQAYGMMGLTPIAGQNDDDEYFSQSDAQTLESFAASHGVAELSFWEVQDYDRATGYAYSRIFNAIGGNSNGGGGGNGDTGQITGYGGKCVDVAGANSANGTQVQLYTCNGTSAQQWTVASNGTLQALGKCMDINAAGTANGTKVQLYDCNGTGAQQWTHTSSNQLVNPNSGKCLDATGPSSADGTPLQIWSCTGGSNQSWNIP